MDQAKLINQRGNGVNRTLLIGLGGFGSRLTDRIFARVRGEHSVSAFSVDTDFIDFSATKEIPRENCLSIALRSSVSDAVKITPEVRKWLPEHPRLLQSRMWECLGQVRSVARLCFHHALRGGKLIPLQEECERLAACCAEDGTELRIEILTSLAGGTGSGICFHLAALLRDRLKQRFPALSLRICADLLFPSYFLFAAGNSAAQRCHMEANAYAALSELNALTKYGISLTLPNEDGTERQVEGNPFDACFLYDHLTVGNGFEGKTVVDTVISRSFSSSGTLKGAFEEGLRLFREKERGTLYALVATQTLPVTASSEEVIPSALGGFTPCCGKRLLTVSSVGGTWLNRDLLPADIVLTELRDSAAKGIAAVSLSLGAEPDKIKKLQANGGGYYHSYQSVIQEIPRVLTPHLDRSWHEVIEGKRQNCEKADAAPSCKTKTENAVFISYCSQDRATAEQIRDLLEEADFSCWMAPESIPLGGDYAGEIPKAIERCKVFLLLLSGDCQSSPWVPKELGLAIGKKKTVVPLQLDRAPLNDAFDFYLTNYQRVSACVRMTKACEELISRLKQLLG